MAIVVTVRPCLSFPQDCQWVAMMWPLSIFSHLLWAQHPVSHCHRIIAHIHTLSLLYAPTHINHNFCGSMRICCINNMCEIPFYLLWDFYKCCICITYRVALKKVSDFHLLSVLYIYLLIISMVSSSNSFIFLGQLVWHTRRVLKKEYNH